MGEGEKSELQKYKQAATQEEIICVLSHPMDDTQSWGLLEKGNVVISPR